MPKATTSSATRRTHSLAIVGLAACGLARTASAEVLDKELSLDALVTLTAVGCAAALGWLNRWAAIVGGIVALAVLLQFYSHLCELHDEFVGPALRAEAPPGYVSLSYAGPLLVVTCHAIAITLRTLLTRRMQAKRRASEAGLGPERLPG